MRFCVKFHEREQCIKFRVLGGNCGELQMPKKRKIDFSQTERRFDVQFGGIQIVPIGVPSEIYVGPYKANPDWKQQEFKTKEKTMTDNFRVNAIPTYEVSNTAGGVTITIGGI